MKTTLTPAEASRRVCPYIQVEGNYIHCLTTRCMRWEVETSIIPSNISGNKFPPVPEFKLTGKGYCGA